MGPKSKKDHSSKDQELEFQKIRLDVFKFGLKHLNKQDKESTKLDQLKRLGADQKNRRFCNFRKLMENKRQEKEKDLTSDRTLKKHLAVELKKQIDNVRARIDRKKSNKKHFSTSAFKKNTNKQQGSKKKSAKK